MTAPLPAALARQLAATVAARKLGLRDFVRKAMGHAWVKAPHLEPLYDLIERCEHEEVRALVSMPPGFAKTTTLTLGQAWLMLRTPADLHAYVSYTGPVTRAKSLLLRDTVTAGGMSPHPDVWNLGEWRNVCGGGLLASGIGGRLTSDRVTGALVIDDPFKNSRAANAPATRDAVSSFYDSTAYTRLVPGRGSIIVVHTRWHPRDLIGLLRRVMRASDGRPMYEEIRLPAIDDAGRALWPEGGYTPAKLAEIKAQLDAENPQLWEAMYLQRPTIKGGAIFKDPARYHPHDLRAATLRKFLGADLAASARQTADATAAMLLGFDTVQRDRNMAPLPRAWELDLGLWKCESPEALSRIRAMQVAAGGCSVGWEWNGVGRPMGQTYRRDYSGATLIEVHRSSDKRVAATSTATAWNDDRILVPLAGHWVPGHIARAQGFTGLPGGEDDDVDALVNGWEAGRRGGTSSGSVRV